MGFLALFFKDLGYFKEKSMKTNLLILVLFFTANLAFAQNFNEVKKSADQGYAKAHHFFQAYCF